MLGKFKKVAVEKMLNAKAKHLPADQKQMFMELFEKNPRLLKRMSKDMKAEMKKNGNNQTVASMKVLPKYQAEIIASMSPEMRDKMMQMQGAPTAGKFNPNGSIRN